jgi:hypothetical protein
MMVGAARNMLKVKGLPGTFKREGEAVVTDVYVLNRSTSKGAGGGTPHELWTSSTPSVQHLSTFRCMDHVKNTHPNLQKLGDRRKTMILVGYELGSMAYHVYDPVTRRVHITRNVVFVEEAKWHWDYDKVDSEFIIEYIPADHHEVGITRHGGRRCLLHREHPRHHLHQARHHQTLHQHLEGKPLLGM